MNNGINDCFMGIREKIKKWYSNLIYMNINIHTKKSAWHNTVQHLLGKRCFCLIHKNTEFIWLI